MFHVNCQLSRRFANRHNLNPFCWDDDSGKEFRTFLHAVESQLPLMKDSNLASEEMALRFYYASNGIVAYVMKLIRYGTYLALKQGQEKIDSSVLAIAFNNHVLADKPHKKNPFITDDIFQLASSSNEVVESGTNVGATSKKLKPKKKIQRASDILHK